jgi:hypothetical protein
VSDALQASVVRGPDGCLVQMFVREPDLVGKKATLTIEQRAKVKRSSPKHAERELKQHSFALAAGQNLIPLGDLIDGLFPYVGSKLDLELKARIVVDDSVFFDTKIELDLAPACLLPPRSAVPDHKGVHSPRDRFSFIANLRAIPAKARLVVIWLIAIGLPLIAINALVGARDQFVPESQVWFYDHTGDDGGESPLMKALMGSGGVGVALWVAIRRQLQKYMRFEARLPLDRLTRDSRCAASDIFSGEARVSLQQSIARVVAYNREHGQYTATEKQGKSTRTVTRSFTENARGVVLFEQLLAYVPANAPLAQHVVGEVDFAPLFDALYPPFMIGSTHGLSLRLEVQLLHPEYVDQEVELDPGTLDPNHFRHA